MRKRNRRVEVHLTEDEYRHLKEQATLSGYCTEEYLRRIIAKQDMKPRPADEMVNIRRQLSAIGNNINQLAKKANSSGYVNQEEIKQIITFQKEVWSLIKGL